ncbi:transporter substrate-binding protein [bacterium]|nr:transporter substrate-binding protein [bacterium]
MIIVLLPALILLFVLAILFLVWDQLRTRVLVAGVIIAIGLLGALGLVRYQFSNSTGCAPDCAGTNLVGRNFRGLHLDGTIFLEANLSRADLSDAQLVGADLSGAVMQSINLEGADLQDAILVGADLTGGNLAGANLTGADISGANLSSATLTGVDLTQTTLRGARFIGAELIGANLIGAQLNAVDLSLANMNGVRMVNANLSGAVLSGADLSGAVLSNSRLSGAWLNLAVLIGANLTNVDLSGSSMIGTDMASADLSDSSLVGSTLIGANLKGANLRGVDLRGVRLDVATLTKEDLALDPRLIELNELQRSRVLFDAQLDGVSFDSQTVWSDSPITARLVGAQPTPTQDENTLKVGLLLSLSGPMSGAEGAIRDGMLLAIDEINTAGGVLGLKLEPVLEGGASNVEQFVQSATRLLETATPAVIFGGSISEKRKALLPLIEEAGLLLFYPLAYEGFETSANVIYMGPDPSQVVIPAVDYLLAQGYRKIVLVGSDTLYSQSINRIIQAQLESYDLTAAGLVYFPLDTTDFSQMMAQLGSVAPDVLINTIQGQGNIDFFTQLNEAGFTAQDLPILSLTVTEEEIRLIGPEIMEGYLMVGSYFQTTQTPDNFAFVTAFKRVYGDTRVTTDAIASGYSAVYLWKSLVETAQSTDVSDLRGVITAGDLEVATPKGIITLNAKTQHVSSHARIGVVLGNGEIEEVFASEGPLVPDPFLSQFDWASELGQALEEVRVQMQEEAE